MIKIDNPFELYYIMCAVRGPDIDIPPLKYIFTARIRALLFDESEYVYIGLTRTLKLKKEDVDELIRRLETLVINDIVKEALMHYLAHVFEAITGLKQEGILHTREYIELLDLYKAVYRYVNGDSSLKGLKNELLEIIGEDDD